MPSVVVTGANRGIGLALARALAEESWEVHACCRHPEKAVELRALAGVELHRLDITDALQVSSLARRLADRPIDLLVNNAAVRGERGSFGSIDYEEWTRAFAINTLAPMRMIEQLAPLVAASERRQIVNVSSVLGSIANNDTGGDHLYRSSKAALNMVTRGLAVDLAGRGITVVAVHPGWVRTELGGEAAPLSPEEAAASLRRFIEELRPEQSGGFFSHDGSSLPW